MRELSIEEAQEKFLNLFAQYHLAYSSYYVLRASSQDGTSNPINGNNNSSTLNISGGANGANGGLNNTSMRLEVEDNDDGASDGGMSRGEGNKETFLATHMNHDLLCVINFNGISFFEHQKRDKVI